MQASQRAKRKEAAGESSGRDPSSSSLSLAFSDIEERTAKKYHTKCQIEKHVIHAAAKRALDAKAKNGGRMHDTWYNGELDANAYNEVIRRMEYRSDNAAKIEEKKKKKMIELKHAVDAIRVKKFTLKDLVVSQLKTMCKWKKQPGDAMLPTTKKALKQLYKKTMHNPSPHVSPYNSDAEEEAGDASDVDSMDSDASVPENDDLEFGKDEYEIDEEE